MALGYPDAQHTSGAVLTLQECIWRFRHQLLSKTMPGYLKPMLTEKV